LGGELVDLVAVDGDERELSGDEERGGEDEGGDGAESDRGVQGGIVPFEAAAVMRAGAESGRLRCRRPEGTVFGEAGASSCVRHVRDFVLHLRSGPANVTPVT
jgi:hypothetical protein